jgi:uncharacterized membrane protein
VHLIEGDRKVFYHESSKAKQKNREKIQELQKENKELREQLKSRVLPITDLNLGLAVSWELDELDRN